MEVGWWEGRTRLIEAGAGEGREAKQQRRMTGLGEGGLKEPKSQEPGRRDQRQGRWQ